MSSITSLLNKTKQKDQTKIFLFYLPVSFLTTAVLLSATLNKLRYNFSVEASLEIFPRQVLLDVLRVLRECGEECAVQPPGGVPGHHPHLSQTPPAPPSGTQS